MTHKRDGKPVVPGRGGYEIEFIEVIGPPDSMMPMPPAKSRGKLTPLGTGEGVPDGVPQRLGPVAVSRKPVPLIPTRSEIETLPRLAQMAFASRCTERVKTAYNSNLITIDHASVADTVARAASVLLETATIDSLLMSQLRCIRRDFVRLKKLVRQEKWTDETPVPPNVFGPMWPEGVAPFWADEFPSLTT
jgi:hypothetical protein